MPITKSSIASPSLFCYENCDLKIGLKHLRCKIASCRSVNFSFKEGSLNSIEKLRRKKENW